MLLFEFVGELFQFEQREPEFAPSFQLPPNSTALLPMRPPAFLGLNPRPKHFANFGDSHLCNLDLVWCYAFDVSPCQKPQPKPQRGQASVCGVKAGHLIGFPRLHKQLNLPQKTMQKQVACGAMLAWQILGDGVQIQNHTFVFFNHRHLLIAVCCVFRGCHGSSKKIPSRAFARLFKAQVVTDAAGRNVVVRERGRVEPERAAGTGVRALKPDAPE